MSTSHRRTLPSIECQKNIEQNNKQPIPFSRTMSSLSLVKIFNIIQGISCILIASLTDCDAFESLNPVLFALGCCLVLSGLCQLYFRVEFISIDTAMGLFVNLIHTGVIICLVWLSVITWGEADRLWDGGNMCDSLVFNFVFIYTIMAAIEIGCMVLFLRPRNVEPQSHIV